MKDKEIQGIQIRICNACKQHKKCDKELCTMSGLVAKELSRFYQPKLPEDSVVLSREEYIDLSRNYVGEQVAQTRKETAEKLLNDFKLWAREYQYKDTVVDENGERPMTNNEKLNYLYTYLCDKYKVEIKE